TNSKVRPAQELSGPDTSRAAMIAARYTPTIRRSHSRLWANAFSSSRLTYTNGARLTEQSNSYGLRSEARATASTGTCAPQSSTVLPTPASGNEVRSTVSMSMDTRPISVVSWPSTAIGVPDFAVCGYPSAYPAHTSPTRVGRVAVNVAP